MTMMLPTVSLVSTLLAVACLTNVVVGFTQPVCYQGPAASVFQARSRCIANLANDADPPMAAAADDNDEAAGSSDGGSSSSSDAIAVITGISGLAGAGASVASTVVTTAGGVCAGGACVAGAGAAAAGGVTTGGAAATAAAAASGGGLLAGAKALVAGAALAAGVVFNGLPGGAADAPTLESMVRASTPLEAAVGNGRPTVMEFYGNACPHCHEAARRLRAVEENAVQSGGFNWVMVDTDDPRTVPLWMKYHVDELPHFEFFDAEGYDVGYEFGEVETQRIEERIAQTAVHATNAFGTVSAASIPP